MFLAYLRLTVEIALWRIRRRWPRHGAILKYALQSGRRTRPIATLLASEAAGGGWRDALPVAVAIELAQRASVIRDDLA
jgi:geranylgeranyl pyrophosphate synthase